MSPFVSLGLRRGPARLLGCLHGNIMPLAWLWAWLSGFWPFSCAGWPQACREEAHALVEMRRPGLWGNQQPHVRVIQACMPAGRRAATLSP
jgi:hypothetical protein